MSKRRKVGPSAEQASRPRVRDIYVPRPFAGLPTEGDWVALRELIPAATAPLTLNAEFTDKYGARDVTVATVLPLAWPALTKPDGRVLLGMQRNAQSGDVSRDLAVSLLVALESEPGRPASPPPLPGPGPRLQDILAPQALSITIRDGFNFWLDEESSDPEVKASLERANASVFPTVKLDAAEAAYWCRFPEKAHVRWVLTDDEDPALATLARLAAVGELRLTEATKFAGILRAHGLLVPVWDLPRDDEASAWEEPLAAFATRYAEARANTDPLDAAERRARQGLVGRQLTLR
jgi:hypothetical protein